MPSHPMPSGPREVFLLAGGRRHERRGPDPLLAHVMARSGTPRPRVACIGAANDDSPGFLGRVADAFAAAGAGAVELAPTVGRAGRGRRARDVLEGADAIFLAGGDVERGMHNLHAAGLLPELRRLRAAGRLFFGLSAGTIMLARAWVRWRDPDDDATSERFDCLGFAPLWCDVHAEEDAWAELTTLLRLLPAATEGVGYGIPAGGALRADPDGTVAALARPAARFSLRNGAAQPLADLAPQPYG